MEAEPVVPSIEEQKKQLSELIKQKLKVGDTWYCSLSINYLFLFSTLPLLSPNE